MSSSASLPPRVWSVVRPSSCRVTWTWCATNSSMWSSISTRMPSRPTWMVNGWRPKAPPSVPTTVSAAPSNWPSSARTISSTVLSSASSPATKRPGCPVPKAWRPASWRVTTWSTSTLRTRARSSSAVPVAVIRRLSSTSIVSRQQRAVSSSRARWKDS